MSETLVNSAPSPGNTSSPRRERRLVIASSYLGTTIEFYDFLLYATASAVVFGPVFFTGLDPWAGTVAAFGTFAAGYLARPLGGVVFGHLGDRLGRKKLLVASMLIMGVASTAIGLVPGADAIGSWGAVILVVLRVLQGIAVGGEWGGAALMALEHSDQKSRGFAASFVNAGAPSGSVLGLLVMSAFSTMPSEQFLAWGWRIPFLFSFVLLIIGLFIRSKVSESPYFVEAQKKLEAQAPAEVKKRVPLLDVLRRPKTLILVTLASVSAFALQTLLSTFAIAYSVEAGNDRSDVLLAFAFAGIISVATTLLMGRLSDRTGRKPLMVLGNILFILCIPAVLHLVGQGNMLLVFLGFTLGIVVQTVMYGPMAAFIAERFGTGNRYTGASLGYQIATLVGGGFTPLVLATLYAGQDTVPVMSYLVALAVVSLIAVLAMKESKDRSLDAESE